MYFKNRGLKATVETVLLYGNQYWTLDNMLTKRIDGCYTLTTYGSKYLLEKQNKQRKQYNGSIIT